MLWPVRVWIGGERRPMSHFDVIALSDFVRGVAPAGDRGRIDRHLADGCARCSQTVDWLRRFSAVASEDVRYEPPVSALRIARAAFATSPWRIRSLPVLNGRITFDSFLAPLAAGVRGPEAGITRFVLYEAGDFALDLQFDRTNERSGVVLMGQVANRRAPRTTLAALPVLVTKGPTVVTSSICNEFGEFHLEYEPRRGLQLQIPIESEWRIELSFDDISNVEPRRH
jgi:hypothetical protein